MHWGEENVSGSGQPHGKLYFETFCSLLEMEPPLEFS